MVHIGEERHSSAGNVYRWSACQWEEQLPLVGEDTSAYPAFGLFVTGL